MFSNIVRFLFKMVVGFGCAVAVLMILLAVAIHVPDRDIIERFVPKITAFEEINGILRSELESRNRTKMLFGLDFDASTLSYDGEVLYVGEAVDMLRNFGVYDCDGVTVETGRTVFYYGQGMVAIVYSEEGNPGSFAERHLSYVSEAFEMADNWYYTENCHLENEN